MTPVRWMTPSDLFQATRTMDRLFDELLGPGGTSAPAREQGEATLPTYSLPVDVLETEDAYVLMAPVAGFAPEAVEVTFDQGVLVISAKAEPLQVQGTWLRQERPYGSWVRRLQLPEQVDSAEITASFEHGLLTVRVPKAAKPQPVRVPVSGAQQKALKS